MRKLIGKEKGNFIKDNLIWFIIVFSAIWGSRLPGISVAGITLFPIRLIAIAWTLYWIFINRNKLHKIKKNSLNGTFIILIIYCALSVTWSRYPSKSIAALIVYVTQVILLLMCRYQIKSRKTFQYVCNAFYLNTLIINIVSLFESFTGIYLSNDVYKYYINEMNPFGLHRPIAAFKNTNNLSVFIILCLPLCFIAADKWKYRRLSKLFIFVLSAIVVFFTSSVTGIVGILIIVPVLSFLKKYRQTNSKLLLFSAGFAITMAILVVIFFDSSKSISSVLSQSSTSRLDIWRVSLQNAREYNFLGSGIGTAEFINAESRTLPPHNFFLEYLCEVGVIGMVCIAYVFIYIVPTLAEFKYYYLSSYIIVFILLFLFSSICPSSMQGYYFLWMILGMFISCYERMFYTKSHEY